MRSPFVSGIGTVTNTARQAGSADSASESALGVLGGLEVGSLTSVRRSAVLDDSGFATSTPRVEVSSREGADDGTDTEEVVPEFGTADDDGPAVDILGASGLTPWAAPVDSEVKVVGRGQKRIHSVNMEKCVSLLSSAQVLSF